jgi:hypothetical protein
MAFALVVLKYILGVIFEQNETNRLSDCCTKPAEEKVLQLRAQHFENALPTKIVRITRGDTSNGSFCVEVVFCIKETAMTYTFDFERKDKSWYVTSVCVQV